MADNSVSPSREIIQLIINLIQSILVCIICFEIFKKL